MKIALVTDTHWGNRNDAAVLLDHQRQFFRDQFFLELQNRKIDTIIHLGDLVDRRKYINFNTAQRLHDDFLEPARDYNLYIIAGNHDVFYKSTNRVNAFNELSLQSKYPNITTIINDPVEIHFGGRNCLFIPWINKENSDKSFEMIETTNADFIFGHLEIAGFEMFRGSISKEGIDKSVFDKFTAVYSGHFHQKSSRGNIHYLGAPYHMTWGDYPSPRGFHVWDTETGELEFIENKNSLFAVIKYDGANHDISELNLAGKYVKVVVDAKADAYLYNKFLTDVENAGPHDLRIIETYSFQEQEEEDEEFDHAEDTQTIIMKTIDRLEVSCDKKDLKDLMNSLYNDAINLEKTE